MHQYTKCWTIILKTTTKGSPYIPMAKARSFTALFGKNKQAMIQDIRVELRCNNQSKTINLFSHVTKPVSYTHLINDDRKKSIFFFKNQSLLFIEAGNTNMIVITIL